MKKFSKRKAGSINSGSGSSDLRLTKRPIGDILVDGRFISREDLERAVQEQRKTNELLGEILVRRNVVKPEELKAALSVQRELASFEDAVKAASGMGQLLGEIFVQAKLITPEQLETALKQQELTGKNLGEIFLEHGWLRESALDAAQAIQQSGVRTPACFLLGEILVASGIITRAHLDASLEKQKGTAKKIGEVLIDAGYAEPHDISLGLNIQRKLLTSALVAVLSIASLHSASAEARHSKASAGLGVSVRVIEYITLNVTRQVSELVITNSDISRGYVDVKEGTGYFIKTNLKEGYVLSFESSGSPFGKILVMDGSREIELSKTGGVAHMPYSGGSGGEHKELNYRFYLSENVKPGTYSWPLFISAGPM